MTHEVEGGAPDNQVMTHMTQGVRGHSRKGGSLKSYNSQGVPEQSYDLQGYYTMVAPLKQVLNHTPEQNKLRLN